MRPLAAPGMPSISVTLFMVKYSSQVALRKREVQKSSQSLEPTVSFPSTTILVQRSKPWRERVLLPRRQILGRAGAQPCAHAPRPRRSSTGCCTHGKLGGSKADLMTPA